MDKDVQTVLEWLVATASGLHQSGCPPEKNKYGQAVEAIKKLHEENERLKTELTMQKFKAAQNLVS